MPELTTYSVTLNSVTAPLAGEINEAYVYIRNNVLTLYAGKKVGDLVLSWVSQEQGDVQLIGYVEGAPPCPMANLTNKPATTYLEPTTVYVGATSITFTAPTSVTVKYQSGNDTSTRPNRGTQRQHRLRLRTERSPCPVRLRACAEKRRGARRSTHPRNLAGQRQLERQRLATRTPANKFDESIKYTVKMQGTLAPYTGDQFMASLNTLTTPSATPGNPSTKTAILPNPNLGGFTTSNPPSALPKTRRPKKNSARACSSLRLMAKRS